VGKKKEYPETKNHFNKNYREKYFSPLEIRKNDDLTIVVRGHLLIETLIEMLLQKNLEQEKILSDRDFTYFMKIELIYSLGLIDKEFLVILQKFGEIRNAFAHQLGVSLNDLKKETNEFVNRIGEKNKELDKLFKANKTNLKLLFGMGISFLLGFLAKAVFD